MGDRTTDGTEDDDLAIELVAAAVYAGAYHALAREFGGGGNHFQTMAGRLSAKVTDLAGEMVERDAKYAGAPPVARP